MMREAGYAAMTDGSNGAVRKSAPRVVSLAGNKRLRSLRIVCPIHAASMSMPRLRPIHTLTLATLLFAYPQARAAQQDPGVGGTDAQAAAPDAATAAATAPVVAAPVVAAPAAGAQPEAPTAAPEASKPAKRELALPRFDILEYVVDGNSVLDTETIERAVYPFLGYGRDMHAVESARAALEARFQAKGFLTVSVTVPEQKVEDGVVRLRVVEGRVGRVRVTGSHYFDLGYIRERAPSVAPGQVPAFAEVQKELGALNRNADRRISPVLHVGREPGTVDVDLNVEDQLPVHGSVDLDNRSSEYTRPLRLNASLRYDNLWQAEHSFGLSWSVAPQYAANSSVLSATYLMPLGEQSLDVYAVHSSSDVVPGSFDTVGKGNVVGARYILPLPGDAALFHSLTLGIDHKQFAETTGLVGQPGSSTPITYVPFLLQYGGFRQDGRGTTQFVLAANLAADGIFGNKDADFEYKHSGASATYLALRGDLTRDQQLPGKWDLRARLSGQASATPLIPNEQFAMGGAESVRGYREAEALGDYGLVGTLEVRTPDLMPAATGERPALLLLGFYDAGNIKVHQPLPDQAHGYSMASSGLGLRLDGHHGLHLAVDLAHALRAGPYTPDGSTRVEFKLDQDF